MSGLANPARNLVSGRSTVATAGTPEPLVDEGVAVLGVAIQAETDNTGVVVVGGPEVDETQASRKGIALVPGQTIYHNISNLAHLYLDVAVNGDGVTYTAETA